MLDVQPHDFFLRPREHDGETALVLVAASGEAEMIHLLVRWMAEVDLSNRDLVFLKKANFSCQFDVLL